MLRKFLGTAHWSQRVRESAVSRDEEGRLNLRLQGGAEYGQLLSLGAPEQGRARSQAGRPQPGDLLLEVNEAPVSGLTLRDALDLLGRLEGPVHIRTVPPGSQLNADLRHFLRQSFPQGSADGALQEQIRRNLYLRAVPCTTRAPREGEVPGADYHFISLSEFQALERAGGLLESGKFNGNYYGTPVPPMVPTDRSLTLDLSQLIHPQRSKSLVHLEKEPGREESHLGRSAGPVETRATGSCMRETEPAGAQHTSATGTGDPTMETGREELPGKRATSSESRGAGDMVPGTTYGAESQNPERMAPKVRDAPSPPDLSHMPGHSVFTTVTKTNHTFGFTIAGGNHCSELLQIVSVAPGGPADRSPDLRIYDVIVAINGGSVLGSTHSQVVRLFQGVPEGAGVGLQLWRGFPPLYDVEPRLLCEANARAPRPPPAALLPLPVLQSPAGPGFTVSRNAGGHARVASVTDRRSCPSLRQGDLILRVNGQRVRGLTDGQLEQVLREHTRGGDSVLLVQRAVTDAGSVPGLSPDSVRCSADGSAQPPAGFSETGAGEGRGEGASRGGGAGWLTGRDLPGADPVELADSRQEPRDPHGWRDEDTSRIVTSSLEAGTWDEAFTGACGKWDAREEDGRTRGRTAARGSSRKHPSVIGASQDLEFYTVELERGATGFGFSIRGGSEYEMDLYVLGMIAGGSAMNSGKIRVGDQLVQINGEKTLGMTHTQAIDLIKQARGSLRLVMRCGNGQVPEYAPETMDGTVQGSEAEVPIQPQPLSLIRKTGTRLQQGGAEVPDAQPARGQRARPERPEVGRGVSRDVNELPVPPKSGLPPRDVAGPEGPDGLTRPQGSGNPSGPQARESQARPGPHSRPQARVTQTGPDPHSGHQARDTHTRPEAQGSQIGPDPQTQGPHSRDPGPHSRDPSPQSCGESSGTDWGSDQSEDGARCPETASRGSFEEWRLLSSLVGVRMEVPEDPGPPGCAQHQWGECPRCGRRGGSSLRPTLAPGPWKVPGRERLLGVVAGWSSG